MKIKVLYVVVSFLAAGCDAKPAATVDKFITNVADGDIPRANNLMNKQRINSDLIRQAICELGLDHNFMNNPAETTVKRLTTSQSRKFGTFSMRKSKGAPIVPWLASRYLRNVLKTSTMPQ